MALAHIVRFLKKLLHVSAEAIEEAYELRRTLARRYPHIEGE